MHESQAVWDQGWGMNLTQARLGAFKAGACGAKRGARRAISETWQAGKEREGVGLRGRGSLSDSSPPEGSGAVPQQVYTEAAVAVQHLGGNWRTGVYYFSHPLSGARLPPPLGPRGARGPQIPLPFTSHPRRAVLIYMASLLKLYSPTQLHSVERLLRAGLSFHLSSPQLQYRSYGALGGMPRESNMFVRKSFSNQILCEISWPRAKDWRGLAVLIWDAIAPCG